MLQKIAAGEPRYVPSIIVDKVTAVHAAYAITLALFHRARTGRGQEVGVPMLETMVAFNLAEHLGGCVFEPPVGKMGYAPVREGMPAVVTILGIDGTLAAKVARVAPAVDPATLLGGVRIQIEGTHLITVGSAATGQIIVAKRPGLLVPATAVRRSTVGADEVVVCDNGVARVRAVTIGQRTETTTEIVQGIASGEQIVTDHVLGLEEGQLLTTPAVGTK